MGIHIVRILVVTTSYPLSPDSVSGVFVRRLAISLSRKHDVRVITLAGSGMIVTDDPFPVIAACYAPRKWQRLTHLPGGIPVQLRQQPLLWALVPFAAAALAFAILRYVARADVIHANWAGTGVVAGVVGWLTRTPVVTTLRGADVSGAVRSRGSRWQLYAGVRLSRRVATVSAAMRDDVLTRWPQIARKVRSVPNGVEITEVHRRTPDVSNAKLLVVGSLIQRKRVDVAIDALAELTPGIKLTVVGAGPERDALICRVSTRGLGGRVEFLGEVPPRSMAALYCRHDVLVHCADSEGVPNVMLEAIASAMPVVAADIPGVRQMAMCTAAGMVFPPGDAAACAEALTNILGSGSGARRWREMSIAARRWTDSHRRTWEDCADDYTALYREALDSTSG